MRFSVIIPCRVATAEHAANLAHCLAGLAGADPAPFETILVDDGSPAAIEIPAGIHVVRKVNGGPASARNAGAAVATGDVLVFVDADIVVPVDAFARLEADFAANPAASAIWGTVAAEHPHAGLVSRYKNLTHRHFTLQQDDQTRHLTTMLAAVRREAFLATGGFDESLTSVSVEDVEFGRDLYEQGALVLLDRGLAAVHHHRFTLGRALKNDFHKARNHVRTTLDRRRKGDASVRVDGPGERRQVHYLVGVPLGAGAVVALLAGRWRLSAALTAAFAVWERDLLKFLATEQGPLFAAACLPLMLVERTTVATAVVVGTADHLAGRFGGRISKRGRLPGAPDGR